MSKSRSVLIVEDENALRDVYEIILKAAGYEVYTAVNGKAGLDAVRHHKPDLVILDILMPIMDGRDFLKNVDFADYPSMKVVVCSNTPDNGLRDEMVELGADKVVLKADMAPRDLVSLVDAYF